MIGDAIMFRIACQWSVFPVRSGGKRPLFEWDRFRSNRADVQEIRTWNAQWNLALATGAISGVVVVDCESAEDAKWFLSTRRFTPLRVKTPRGYHLYFRHPGWHVGNAAKVPDDKGKPRYDIRGDGGYVLLPPSKVSNSVSGVSVSGSYQFDRCDTSVIQHLPVFQMQWHRQVEVIADSHNSTRNLKVAGLSNRRVADGISYISHIQAMSGSGGHNDTYRAVCRLRDSGLNSQDALQALIEWNATNAQPPWSPSELQHKIKSVYRC